MPKRKQRTVEYYENKIRRLQQKAVKRRRLISDSTTDAEGNPDVGPQEEHFSEMLTFEPEPDLEQATEPGPELTPGLVEATQPEDPLIEVSLPELDPEMLSALGDATEDAPVFGDKIHQSLSQRWIPILKKGLAKDLKAKLKNEYPIPDYCRLLKAPTLNPEISAAVAEVVKNRDKSIQAKQDQLGHGISAINKAMTLLLLSDDKVQAVKILSDGCRLLTDLHFTETQLRTKLITPCLQKSILSVIEEQDRDETLFGVNLPEKIRSSKAIKKIVGNKPTMQAPGTASPRTRFQENWQGPPRYPSSSKGGRGGQNYRAPPSHFRRIATGPALSTARAAPIPRQSRQRVPRQ